MLDPAILFKPLTSLINKRIGEQTVARDLAAELAGECMAIRVDGTGLAVFLHMVDGMLELRTRYEDEPSVVLSGSPLSLAKLAGKDPQSVIRQGQVKMSGDALLGEKFQKLLRFAQPDLEDELAGVVGDVAAHQAGNLARSIAGAAESISDKLYSGFGDYLTEDSEALPSQEQFAAFRKDIEHLRDDVARAEARVAVIKSRRAEGE
ncbi:MAG: SCP2 sterol-binding domain-containing protein [Pseudomonadota bacterium]